MTQIDFPFHFDGRKRTADTSYEDHVRDLIEQVLFTAPGERVNRPTFGSGLLQLVFSPNSPEVAAATQLLDREAGVKPFPIIDRPAGFSTDISP